jgi:imidazolonepropionase-like amidohydrolase
MHRPDITRERESTMKLTLDDALFTCAAALLLSATAVRAQTLTINNASVIDVTTGNVLRRATIEIDGNRIGRIRTVDAARPVRGELIDGTGLFVMPGLWDMHVHSYFGDSTTFPGGSQLILPLFIANGVTGIRDMGSNLDAVLHARDSVRAHTLVGPRMVVSGPMLDGPRSQYAAAIRIATPDEGRAAVRMLKERGVDFIKVQSGVPRDAYFAIADEAHRVGIPFEGHVPDAIRAVEAIRAHQASFEHLLGVFEASSRLEDSMVAGGRKGQSEYLLTYDAGRERSIIRELAQHHTWQCPTLASDLNTADDFAKDPALAFWPRRVVDRWREGSTQFLESPDTAAQSLRRRFGAYELALVHKMNEAHIPFLAGTDAPAGFDLVPGGSLHRELQWLVAAGFTPLQALQAATLNPATFLGRTGDFGSVSPGKVADLVLLSANPLADIANTRTVVAVIADGRYYSRTDLDRLRLRLMGIAASR